MPLLINTITLGDCLDLLPHVPDASVAMILCDLPYGVTSAQWDSIIPLDRLWAEYKRVIAPRGAIVLTAVQPFTSLLVSSNLAWYRHNWVWDKGRVTGFLNAKKAPLRQHEDILVFAAQAPAYYPVMTERPKTIKRRAQGTSVLYSNFKRIGGEYAQSYPKSILSIPQNGAEHIHPTQKPVALFEYLINTYSQPGAVVLDTCSGSGTTAIAALRTGRQFICMERDADYHAASVERLSNTQLCLTA